MHKAGQRIIEGVRYYHVLFYLKNSYWYELHAHTGETTCTHTKQHVVHQFNLEHIQSSFIYYDCNT